MALHARATPPRRRGLVTRGLSVALGSVLGASLVALTNLPVTWENPRAALSLQKFEPLSPVSPLQFASVGSSAVSIPDLHVLFASPHEKSVPIASLTKLMTAYVVLKRLPLVGNQLGPCLMVTTNDVATYRVDQKSNQSSVKVIDGEQLCERSLLDGLFVHSANNYADLLIRLTGPSVVNFVQQMNRTARQLSMTRTHYVDGSGFNAANVSTAKDQLRLVVRLMHNALVRQIARQTSVILPAAGSVRTYTPLLGTKGVVGIKSGRTAEAGGCDALALQTSIAGVTFLTYAVVLSQTGPNVLQKAGNVAFELARSAVANISTYKLEPGDVVGQVGWPGAQVNLTVANPAIHFAWRHGPRMTVLAIPVIARRCFTNLPVPLTLQTMRVEGSWSSTHVPRRWTTDLGASNRICGGFGLYSVQYGAGLSNSVIVVPEHTVTRPSWWRGLL